MIQKAPSYVLIFLYAAAAVLCGLPAAAQSWTIDERTAEGDEMLTILSGGGRIARVISGAPLEAAEVERIGGSLNAVWAIPGLEGREAAVRVEGEGFRLVVYPVSFVYNHEDFLPRLPVGLAFYYRTALFYDVTLKVDNYMPRVTGAYISPEGFLKALSAAVFMPEMYMYDEALLRRIERLETALMAVIKKSAPRAAVAPELITAVINLYNENPGITPAQAVRALRSRGIRATANEVRAVFMVLLGEE
jgi:hypothetical protein